MSITVAAIAKSSGNTILGYVSKKVLDILFSEPKFEEELSRTILKTLEEYELEYPKLDEGKKFPFFHSQRLVDELLKYRIMQDQDYDLDELLAVLKTEVNVITPSKIDIENFYRIFTKNIKSNSKLKKLEIKQTFDTEIFNISRILKEINQNNVNVLLSFSADLENQWKNRLQVYVKTLQEFKPTTALGLLNELLNSVKEGTKKPSNEFLSFVEYQKGVCYGFLNEQDNNCKSFISAFKQNPSNTIFKERASLAYYRIGENAISLKLAEELLFSDEFNSTAWAIKILNSKIDTLLDSLSEVPTITKKDVKFKRLIFNNFASKKQKEFIELIYENGLMPYYNEYKKIPVTVDTFSEHIFWINITINAYFSNFFLSFTRSDDEKSPVIHNLNTLTKDFLNSIANSEIDKNNELIHFFHAYTNFVITKDKKFASEMKNWFRKLNSSDYLYLAITSNSLQLAGFDLEAIELIENHPSEKKEVLMMQAYCYVKVGEMGKYTEITKQFLEVTKEVNEKELPQYVNTIMQLRAFNKLSNFALDDFIIEKKFVSENDKILVQTIVQLLITGHSNSSINKLKVLSEQYNEPEILGFIGETLHLIGENETAVNVYRRFLDKEVQSHHLLCYIYALYNTKKDNTELLQLLENWRTNFDLHLPFLKSELYIRGELLDWDKCIEICEYYLLNDPDDEYILANYVIFLFNKNTQENKQKLIELSLKLRNYSYQFLDNVSTISNILIRIGNFNDGLEILYKYARIKENKILRQNYFLACALCSQDGLEKSPLKELEEAEERSFIKYEMDHKVYIIELTEENIKEDFFKNFLGVRQGSAITTKRPFTNKEDLISIRRVMNKYLSLHDEIIEEVSNDPYSGIPMTSINFDGNDLESLNKTLISFFGEKGTIVKFTSEDELKKYYNGEISFSQIIVGMFKNDYLGGYHHLVSQQDGITSIPLKILNPIFKENAEFVIDASSLIILFQLSQAHEVKYLDKFIISGYIVEMIKRQLAELSHDIKSNLSISITTEKVIPHFYSEESQQKNIIYVKNLLSWIEENCLVQISNRVLEFTRNIEVNQETKPFLNYLLNTVLLMEENDSRLLVTDDLVYLKLRNIHFNNIISSEFFIKRHFKTSDHLALYEFIKNKYLGFSPTSDQLYSEYLKKISLQPNFYNTCLENINLFRNPYMAIEAIKHVKEIALSQILLPNQISQDITTIFVVLLRGVDQTIRTYVKEIVKIQCYLLGNRYNLILESMNSAYDILDSY